jgi:hypothetical protein
MSKNKNKKYVRSVDYPEVALFAILYLSFASFYISFLIFPYSLWVLYVIFYAILIIPIIIFSYCVGKKIAIYCQSMKKCGGVAKYLFALIVINTCLSVLIFILYHGLPARVCEPNRCYELSIFGAALRAFIVSAVCIVPGLFAALRKYNVKAIKNKSISSKAKKVSRKKKEEDSDEF